MVDAGANITAFLRLDASDFKSGLSSVSTTVTKFKESMVDVGKQSSSFTSGVHNVTQALQHLRTEFTSLSAVDKSLISKFKNIASALQSIATAAQRMSVDAERGSVGMSALSQVMEIFRTGAKSAEVQLKLTNAQLSKLSSTTNGSKSSVNSMVTSFESVKRNLQEMQTGLYRYGTVMSETQAKTIYQTQLMTQEYRKARQELFALANGGAEAFNYMSNHINRVNSTLNSTISKIGKFSVACQQMNSSLANYGSTMSSLNTTTSLASQRQSAMSNIVNSTNSNLRTQTSAVQGLTPTLNNLSVASTSSANSNRNLSSSSKEASSSQTQLGRSTQSASTGMNRASNSARGLRNSMMSLKNAVTLVGSMFAYNFLHHLGQAVNETINAKSEMMGYFKMLGFGQGQVNSFNSALDRTVAQFQRVNKYSLGETISSIGVEFNLTTKEMEKAMKVTSMITSEYLRAGRNANEASLAVKDVLQGQFQRLSRETGVKQENLKEAGWSGDTNDVMGLMKALEKVGKSRNWDIFAEKANSLNDIVTILQNRFGEWSADLADRVTPTIVSAFNELISIANHFGAGITKVLDWLGEEGWGQTAIQIAGVTTALVAGYGALVSYRTGANLVQIAQMGLKDSIIATILGLEAETVAEHNAYTALVMRATGLKATEIAEIGRTKALMSAVLGLDMATVKEYGFKNALLSSLSGVKASKIATDGLGVSLKGLAVSFGLPLAVIIPFTIALGKMAMDIQASTQKMAKFYDILQNGDQIVSTAKDGVSSLKDRLKELQETQKKYTVGSQEYINTGKAIEQINNNIKTAVQGVKDAEEAKQIVQRAEQNYQNVKLEKQLELERDINSTLIDVGLSTEQARLLSNDYLRDAVSGSDKLYETLQKVALQYQKTADAVKVNAQALKDAGYDDAEIELKIKPLIDSGTQIAQAKEELGQAKSLSEYVDKWFWLQVQEITHTLTESSIKFDTVFKKSGGDWAKALYSGLANAIWGAIHGLAELPVGKWVQQWVEDMGWKGKGSELFKNFDFADLFEFLSNFSIISVLEKSFKLDQMINDGKRFFDNLISNWWNSLIGGEGNGITTKKIDINGLLSAIFGFLDSSGVNQWFDENIKQPIMDWWSNFTSDPISALGLGDIGFGISGLLNALFNTAEDAYTTISTWFTDSFITPLQTIWTEFSADPVGYIGGLVFDFGLFLNTLFGGVSVESVGLWVQNNIITPFGSAIYNGIMSIPIVSDIMSLFGLVTDEGTGANSKGHDIGKWIGNGLSTAISQIPIVSDILRILGLIPSTNPTANSNGHGVGDNIKQGVMNGISGLANLVSEEFSRVVNAIAQKAGEAYQAAANVGGQIIEGIRNAMDMHSPSILSRELIPQEFGVNIPDAITGSADVAYSSAQYYGQQMVDGINSVNTTGVGLGGMVGEYQADAQTIAMSSQLMGTETTTAFNDMQTAVNTTTNTMVGNVNSSYTSMQQKQLSSLNSMKTNNITAYNDMYLKSNQSLLQMRNSTTNVTNQMISAWSHMKNQLVATANQLRSESTAHFNTLSNTIGSFYRKIQNPSSWGSAGGGSRMNVRTARHPSAGKSFTTGVKTRGATHYAGGFSPYENNNKTMSLRQLKSMICPSGDCDLFDGYDLSDKVNVSDFLSKISGEHGFGSWNNWKGTHYNYIKNKSDQWSMKSPTINLAGGIPTNADYKVGDFENGTPKISFSSFESMARSIFTTIPYRFYYDSNWKGSWLGALQAGACNCWDGAHALLAFANTCGFGGGIAHGTWNGIPHVWAVINGKKMDTTGMQQRGTWTPSASAGGLPTRRANAGNGAVPQSNKTVNVTNDFSGATIIGIDNLDEHINDATNKALEEYFNDSYSVPI